MSTLANSDLFIVQRPTGGDAGTYSIDWENILDNIASSPAVQFKGTANFTAPGEDPAPAQNGDLYANTTDGTFAWANPEESNKAVVVGDYCIWDADDGVWRFTGGVGGGTAPITSVDANLPLSMVGGDTEGDVVIESREATTTESGHVARLATAADVDKDSISSGRDTAVVTADLLQATNIALDAATAGGVSNVTGVNPKTADIPTIWVDNADTSTYDTPAINVYDEAGNTKAVYVQFATIDQVGVSYVAPAGNGAVIEFNKALENDSSTMDDFGMMTTRRTFVNFVPRNFSILNELPV